MKHDDPKIAESGAIPATQARRPWHAPEFFEESIALTAGGNAHDTDNFGDHPTVS